MEPDPGGHSEGLPLVQQPRYHSLGELKFVSEAARQAASRVPGYGGGRQSGNRPFQHLVQHGHTAGMVGRSKIRYLRILRGVILTLLVIPERLRHRWVTLRVDNVAVVWSWRKRRMKADGLASVLIWAMRILEAALPCSIHVEHLPRLSTPAAAATDRLTRRSTSTSLDLALLTHPKPTLPEAMQRRLHFPNLNWNLGIDLAIEINK